MARITGNGRDNVLIGTAEDDLIFGAPGDDYLRGGGGLDFIRGGRGHDQMEIGDQGWGFGGVGGDFLTSSGADLGGGPGSDILVTAGGNLYGDAAPGEVAPRVGGDDLLITGYGVGEFTQTGGGGSDIFTASMTEDDQAGTLYVTDFRPGEDKLDINLAYLDVSTGVTVGELRVRAIFDVLDTGGDGILGNDAAWDANSEVFSDVANNRLIIRLHEDHWIVDGVTQVSEADFLL